MSEERPPDPRRSMDGGLFKKYPRLSIIIIAAVAYGLMLGMCIIVGILMLRG